MRILIAGQTYKPSMSGQGIFTIHLAEGLARLGHDVLVAFPSDHLRAYRAVRNGVRLRAITALPLAPLDADVSITPRPGDEVHEVVDEFAPEVVHLQDHYPLSRGGIPRRARARSAADGHKSFFAREHHRVHASRSTQPALAPARGPGAVEDDAGRLRPAGPGRVSNRDRRPDIA